VPDGHIWMIAGYSADVNGGDISPYVEIYGPIVKLTKSTAAAGETLGATGVQFAANADITVRAGNVVIGSGQSDGNGSATTVTLTVPAGTPAGKLTLTFSDVRSQYPITVPLTIQ
jgi:5'-nucleotidase